VVALSRPLNPAWEAQGFLRGRERWAVKKLGSRRKTQHDEGIIGVRHKKQIFVFSFSFERPLFDLQRHLPGLARATGRLVDLEFHSGNRS